MYDSLILTVLFFAASHCLQSLCCFFVCPVTEATEEVSLDSPERDVLLSDGPSPAITPITPPTSVITPRIGITHDDMFTHSSFDEVGCYYTL